MYVYNVFKNTVMNVVTFLRMYVCKYIDIHMYKYKYLYKFLTLTDPAKATHMYIYVHTYVNQVMAGGNSLQHSK